MAVEKRNDTWRVRVRRRGHADVSATFDRKSDAEAYERKVLREIDTGRWMPPEAAVTVGAALDSYLRSPGCTARKSAPMPAYMRRLRERFGSMTTSSVAPPLVAAWRDALLAEGLAAQTVVHHLNLLSVALNHANREMGATLASGSNPLLSISKPSTRGAARERRLEGDEEQRLFVALESQRNGLMPALVRLAILTAARQGELLKLCWPDVDLKRRVMLLRDTKNGDARGVPLSSAALAVFETLRTFPRADDGRVFPLSKILVTQAWGRACAKARIDDLRFHDLRHEAVSRLAERGDLGVLELAAISGHKTLAMLKRYTHLQAEKLAQKLG